MYPDEFAFIHWGNEERYAFDKLLGTDAYRTGKVSAQELIAQSREPVRQFGERVQKYLLYTD